ncbi:MAG: hypothetical protein HOD94_06885 [Rhodobacteraceae bacterium]|nr:hypothetical protein [Paracoccaceae bacterium]
MSNNESFIQEVSEEVRRDRLYRILKKWGWIGIAVIVALVGGASFNEWNKDSKMNSARNLGDRVLSAVSNKDPIELKEIETSNISQDIFIKNLLSAILLSDNKLDASKKALEEIRDLPSITKTYRELNAFKLGLLLLKEDNLTSDERFGVFEEFVEPGSPFRLLAKEQQALILIEQGKLELAIKALTEISVDSETTASLKRRVTQLRISLGSDPNDQ